MKSSPLPRKTTRVSDSLHRQLNMYALAASAAGVSLLALAAPSEAEIISRQIFADGLITAPQLAQRP
jgi:hypothetical protein